MTERRSPPVLTFGFYALFLFALLPFDAYRWGDGLEFTAVSGCLGIAHPTGYPFFTLLGWMFLKLPFAAAYIRMLILCRLATLAAVLAVYEFTRMVLAQAEAPTTFANLMPRLVALGFAFSSLVLSNCMAVEVYALNAALMAWIAVLSWKALYGDQARCNAYVGGAAILLGLAASHHLTSLCLAPFFLGMLLYRARVTGKARTLLWILPAVLIPIGFYATMPLRFGGNDAYGIFWGTPQSLEGILDILRGGEYRQYQFLMLARDQPFTAATYLSFATGRVLLILQYTGAIVVGTGPTAALGGILLLAAAATGTLAMLRGRIAGIAIAGILVAQALLLAFIFLYNIPDIADYLLGFHVLLLPFAAYGLWVGGRALLGRLHFASWKVERALITLACALALLAAFVNLRSMNRESVRTGIVWRDRLLNAIPEGAALITGGDSDIYTIWYEQFAGRRRTDVFAYGGNFQRFPWFRMSLPPNDPRRDAVQFQPGPPPQTAAEYIENVRKSAIEPLLAGGRVFTTISVPMELSLLERDYRLIPSAQLLTDKELLALYESGEFAIGAPMLYEITLKKELPPKP